MKRDRVAELHFYEWRATTWAMSETRDRLDATGRGIYRELLDQCYTQGKFPDEPEWICRKCACTPEQYEKAWPRIARHFPISNESGYRWNVPANIVRREYFRFVSEQRENGRKRWAQKSNGINETDRVAYAETEIGSGLPMPNTKGIQASTPDAPNGAYVLTSPVPSLNGNGHGPKPSRDGKRSIEQIKKALGDRLVWWEEFWKVYPCHLGVNRAMDAFERKVLTHDLAVQVYRGAKSYAAKCEADPELKMKYGQGWINEERWKDEIVVRDVVKSKQQRIIDMIDRA